MYLFDEKQQLKKYSTVEAIIDRYYPVRFEGYEKRKKYQLKILERKMNILNMKARFIKEVMDGTIVLVKKKKKEVIEILKSKNYKVIDEDNDYGYLRSLPIDSMEEENWKKLLKDLKECEKAFITLKKKSIQKIWTEELEELEEEFKKYQKEREKRVYGFENKKSKSKKTKKKPVK